MKAEANTAIEQLRNVRGVGGFVPQAPGAIMTEEDEEHIRYAAAAKANKKNANYRRKVKQKEKKKGLHEISRTAPFKSHVTRRLQGMFARIEMTSMLAQSIVSAQAQISNMVFAAVNEAFHEWEEEKLPAA